MIDQSPPVSGLGPRKYDLAVSIACQTAGPNVNHAMSCPESMPSTTCAGNPDVPYKPHDALYACLALTGSGSCVLPLVVPSPRVSHSSLCYKSTDLLRKLHLMSRGNQPGGVKLHVHPREGAVPSCWRAWMGGLRAGSVVCCQAMRPSWITGRYRFPTAGLQPMPSEQRTRAELRYEAACMVRDNASV